MQVRAAADEMAGEDGVAVALPTSGSQVPLQFRRSKGCLSEL